MREFKVVQMNAKGKLINTYEMFSDMEAAESWGDKQNEEVPGSVVDIEFMDVNEEMKYEF